MLHDIFAKYLIIYIVASLFMKWAKSLGRVSGQGGVEMRVSRRRTLNNDDKYSSFYSVQLHYNVLNDAKEKQNAQSYTSSQQEVVSGNTARTKKCINCMPIVNQSKVFERACSATERSDYRGR